jgi:hypothetical protein
MAAAQLSLLLCSIRTRRIGAAQHFLPGARRLSNERDLRLAGGNAPAHFLLVLQKRRSIMYFFDAFERSSSWVNFPCDVFCPRPV